MTNKSSNILEDLEILRILAKIVPDYAQSLDEEGITKAAFDLLFAFDEVISLGYKENVTLQQVRQNTEMESHEEKLYKMIIQSKRQEAIQNMRQKAQEIDRAKMESAKAGRGMASYSPTPSMGSRAVDLDNTPTYMSQNAPTAFSTSRPGAEGAKPAKKGMQLGKAKKANDFLDSLRAEVPASDFRASMALSHVLDDAFFVIMGSSALHVRASPWLSKSCVARHDVFQ